MNTQSIGHRRWAIPEGYIPSVSHGPAPELISHEALCVLNSGEQEAHLEVTIFFTDRDPVGTYRMTVPARRTCHFRFNEFRDPARHAVCEPDRVGCAGGRSAYSAGLTSGGERPDDDDRVSRGLTRFPDP